jgi:hypothetical protein
VTLVNRDAFHNIDTDGEVFFAMGSTLTHQDFQRPTKHEPRRLSPTSPSVSHLISPGYHLRADEASMRAYWLKY